MRKRFVEVVGTLGASGLAAAASSHTFATPLTYANGVTVPDLAAGDYFMLSVISSGGLTLEVIRVNNYTASTGAVSSGGLLRGREGTADMTHAGGLKVVCSAYPSDLGSEASWEDLIAGLGSTVKHRWKFDEASGSTVADAVGSLTLTFSGSAPTNYVRNSTGGPPGLGGYTQFISAHADSASIGNIPIGATDRDIVCVYRTAALTEQMPWCYGSVSSSACLYCAISDTPNAAGVGDLTAGTVGSNGIMRQPPSVDNEWHVASIGIRGSGKIRTLSLDGRHEQVGTSTAVATSTSIFRVGSIVNSTTWQFIGDIAEIFVCDTNLPRETKTRLARFVRGSE